MSVSIHNKTIKIFAHVSTVKFIKMHATCTCLDFSRELNGHCLSDDHSLAIVHYRSNAVFIQINDNFRESKIVFLHYQVSFYSATAARQMSSLFKTSLMRHKI